MYGTNAADLATAFRNAPDCFLDQEVGGSRPVTESMRKFLGRDFDNRSFLEQLSIGGD